MAAKPGKGRGRESRRRAAGTVAPRSVTGMLPSEGSFSNTSNGSEGSLAVAEAASPPASASEAAERAKALLGPGLRDAADATAVGEPIREYVASRTRDERKYYEAARAAEDAAHAARREYRESTGDADSERARELNDAWMAAEERRREVHTGLIAARREAVAEVLAEATEMARTEDASHEWEKGSSKQTRSYVEGACRYFPASWVRASTAHASEHGFKATAKKTSHYHAYTSVSVMGMSMGPQEVRPELSLANSEPEHSPHYPGSSSADGAREQALMGAATHELCHRFEHTLSGGHLSHLQETFLEDRGLKGAGSTPGAERRELFESYAKRRSEAGGHEVLATGYQGILYGRRGWDEAGDSHHEAFVYGTLIGVSGDKERPGERLLRHSRGMQRLKDRGYSTEDAAGAFGLQSDPLAAKWLASLRWERDGNAE